MAVILAMPKPDQQPPAVPPGKSRIELYNPDGSVYFRADVEPAVLKHLHELRRAKKTSFQVVVHQRFALGPVTTEKRELVTRHTAPYNPPKFVVPSALKDPAAPAASEVARPQTMDESSGRRFPLPEPPLTTEEFAAQVRRDPHTIRRWVKNGVIIGHNIVGRILIPRAELQRLMDGAPLPKPGPKKR